MSKAQKSTSSLVHSEKCSFTLFTVTVTEYKEAQGEERERVYLGADRAQYVFAPFGHLSSLVHTSAEGNLTLFHSPLFIGILGHEHLNPEHDHSSY